mgnify:CR=1 FL=1
MTIELIFGVLLTEQCREGHTGPYCDICIDDYRAGATGMCERCSKENDRLVIILVPIFLVLFLLLLAVGWARRYYRLLVLVSCNVHRWLCAACVECNFSDGLKED